MAIQQAGGAQAKIKEVAVEAARAERVDGDGLTYALHGTWTALGTVGHWGHLHQRKNRCVRTLSLSEAKMKLSAIVDAVSTTDEEVVITKNGAPAAVLVSPDEFESWRETMAMSIRRPAVSR